MVACVCRALLLATPRSITLGLLRTRLFSPPFSSFFLFFPLFSPPKRCLMPTYFLCLMAHALCFMLYASWLVRCTLAEAALAQHLIKRAHFWPRAGTDSLRRARPICSEGATTSREKQKAESSKQKTESRKQKAESRERPNWQLSARWAPPRELVSCGLRIMGNNGE